MTTREAIYRCIELAGGGTELARKIGVTYKTIQDWKSGRTGISITNCLKLEQALEGKVTREEILPSYNWSNFNPPEKKDEKLEIAKNLLAAGVDVDTIVKTTGISAEELKKI